MKYYSDGFTLDSNPSPLGGGYSVVDENSNLIKLENINKVNFTNNEGELRGCLEALRIAEEGDTVSIDSKIIILWIKNPFGKKAKRKDLTGLKHEGKLLLQKKNINLIWEPREYNKAGHYNQYIRVSRE